MNRIRSALRFLLHDAFLRVGFRLSRVKPFEAKIRRWELVNEDFYFVQVGAHNGVTSDPFNQMLTGGQWHALLIEPQLPFVQILRTIYGDRDRVQCCNAAVSPVDGTIKMFKVRSDVEGLPYWCSQLASLNYEVIASHEDRIPGLRNWIVEVEVPSRTLASLMASSHYPRIDLLAIDVEGFDYEVLKQIDSICFLPHFIYFEHRHLSPCDYRESLTFLAARGYQTTSVNDGDSFAERTSS